LNDIEKYMSIAEDTATNIGLAILSTKSYWSFLIFVYSRRVENWQQRLPNHHYLILIYYLLKFP